MRAHSVGRRGLLWWGGAGVLVLSAVVVARAADLDSLVSTISEARADPGSVVVAVVAYALAFGLRAVTWTRVLPSLPFAHALSALHLSLAGNHVLPLRLGEALRVTSVVRRARVPLAAATASTVVMRAADVVGVVAIAAVLGPRVAGDLLGPSAWAVAVPGVALWAASAVWLSRAGRRTDVPVRTSSVAVASTAVAAWVLESVMIFEAARWAGIQISFLDAVLVTAVTIAAQVIAIAPAGLGTYEAAATAAMVSLGARPGAALAAALTAHALKTGYSLATGGIALFAPAPGALGKLRLPRERRSAPVTAEERREGPIVLFLPAHNEEATVADLVARTPRTIAGHDVECVVVDDGSTDRTADRARAAGADVISLPRNLGLGAAVRTGLQEAVRREAVAVAFCDADGEYLPEELPQVVAPILEGRADYVAGSRFSGDIRRMLPHRRIGNVLLTRALSFLARAPITDGQSGYRALSAEAARVAEVIHDFNYAQVLTLDLIDKGFRYEEVPITYRWRREGRSFVRPGRYLRNVVPAVHRELNSSR
jgi:uncharacterized membrane protein YbhN (UPF0104 family)